MDHPRLTQVGRALRELGIQPIPAYSPKAHGRSERGFGTWQGRLPQELGLRGLAFDMAYRKRVFLNPISLSAPSFIQAVADSSDEGAYLLGSYVLIIADCHRNIMARIQFR